MNGRSNQPTNEFVKGLLGDPDDPKLIFDDDSLTRLQKVGFALVRIADDVTHLRKEGCAVKDEIVMPRIEKLEHWKSWAKGVLVGLSGLGLIGVIALILKLMGVF